MREAVLIAAVRTAIGKFQGSLSPLSAVDLGACVVREVVRRAGIEPAQVDDPFGDDARFACARPGDDQERPFAVFHRQALFRIEFEHERASTIIPLTFARKQAVWRGRGRF